MKRYTGQKALYEAISRSQAKAKRGSILERLRPEAPQQEQPAVDEPGPEVEPVKTGAEVTPPVAKEQLQPPLKKPPEPVTTEKKPVLERRPDKAAEVKKPIEPLERLGRPVVKSPPDEPLLLKAAHQSVLPEPAPRRLRLKPLLLSAGRIEISVPYHIGVAVALAVLLVILAAFRVGQRYPDAKTLSAAPAKPSVAVPARKAASETTTAKPPQSKAATAPPSASEPAQTGGDHVIVLAQHKNEADLQPVVDHYAKGGVELRIHALRSGDGYLLITNRLYDNPDRPGTDGYEIKQKIIELGKTYKAPQGRETFAAKRFSDAYGWKVK